MSKPAVPASRWRPGAAQRAGGLASGRTRRAYAGIRRLVFEGLLWPGLPEPNKRKPHSAEALGRLQDDFRKCGFCVGEATIRTYIRKLTNRLR